MSSESHTNFVLDERLARDTVTLCQWPLSRVLLMNDSRYPWIILVPTRPGVTELFELSVEEAEQLSHESRVLAQWMKHHFVADKLNVASLGNVVAQLHVHHVARFRTDEAWPAPVWGRGEVAPYEEADLVAAVNRYRAVLMTLPGLDKAS